MEKGKMRLPMKKSNKKNILKFCLILFFIIYVTLILIKQQNTLNSYKNEKEYLADKISEQTDYKNELISKKQNVNSNEYIEQIAREKLNMYMPNERVYIDVRN